MPKKSMTYKDAEAAQYRDNDSDRSNSDDDAAVAPARSSRARGAPTRETPFRVKCWRYLLFGVTCCLAVALCINLWASYGDFLEDSIWPPRVSSVGTACPADGTVKNAYQMEFVNYEVVHNDTTAGWVRLNATKPPTSVLWAYDAQREPANDEEAKAGAGAREPRVPVMLDAHWDANNHNQLLVWVPAADHCATVMVFST